MNILHSIGYASVAFVATCIFLAMSSNIAKTKEEGKDKDQTIMKLSFIVAVGVFLITL